MDGYQKTGFQKFRETKASPPAGMAAALAVTLLFVVAGLYETPMDGLIIALLSFMILRLFRAKKIEILLLFAAIQWISVSLYKTFVDGFDIGESFYITAIVITLPFTILSVLVWWMRNSLERTRARLEAEGRLYPPGYGRCKRCGTIVLPGEISCRRCGEYIDVPEEMRVKKVNFFECSECGREVPEDAGVCPFCGEAFDEDIEKEQ